MHIDELETPFAAINLDKLESNIVKLQRYLDEHSINNRPHIKTHKIPEIAHMQIKAGAVGITCQKLGEAEVMAQAGIRDILVTYNIIGKTKLERLMRLTKSAKISVTADSEFTVNGLSTAAQCEKLELAVLVEFDSGAERCGVQSPQEAAALARLISKTPGLHFAGLMTYPSNTKTDTFIQQTKALLKHDNIQIECVSGGGTPNMWQAHTFKKVTEHRAGTYVYGDRHIIKSGAMSLDECAFTVTTTVVSCPTPERAILDGGSKTFSSDLLDLDDYGTIIEYPEARIYSLSEEHGHVDLSACKKNKPQIGERLTVIPNHCCVVSNLFNQIIGLRGNSVEVIWPVAARGAVH
jgi:D-serine deaminase-like pyridoxal phosphate-dependent protein